MLSTKGMRTLSRKWWGGSTEEDDGTNQMRRMKKGDSSRRNGIVRGEEVGKGVVQSDLPGKQHRG